ncbi:MAG: hypothetical protein M3071_06930 [Actinomycetota bacterium]|nr:hypothetical protein [Actinomycetota bacterium]
MQGSLRVLNGVSWRVFALTVCQIVVASAGRGACAAWAATTDASVLGATQYGADTKIFSSGTDGGLWQLVWNGSGPTEIPRNGRVAHLGTDRGRARIDPRRVLARR